TWIYTIGELYGGITCMMGVMGAVGGLSWGGTTSTGGNVVGGVSQPSWMSDYATPGNAWRFNTPVTTDI
ncbi:MAG: hypothetical protein QXN71_00650, partial [Candidatus Aenigmatarchaeota archaeon]